MAKPLIRSIKGTHDILPDQSWRWQRIENTVRAFMKRFGYREIRTPVFERTELFARGVGQETDIVSKEMYSFVDKSGNNLTLKPEVTASVIRAYLQHNLGRQSPMTKLYYLDRAFRQERPQAGRYRQHHQFGVEAIGSPHPETDAEVISIAHGVLKELGLSDLELRLNSIGSQTSRTNYRQALKAFLKPHLSELSETSRRRFDTNPLRILDTKVPHEIEILKDAPVLTDYLTPEDAEHFDAVKTLLRALGIPFVLDSRLVRGLDYYTRTTFEFTSSALGAQNALCGGGRYDHLVETLGGKPTPAIGFAAGIERILLALETNNNEAQPETIDIYFVCLDENARPFVLQLANKLRGLGFTVETDLLRRSLKAQLREANRLHARLALIIGETEFQNQTVQVKDLTTTEQKSVNWDSLVDYISRLNFNSE
ncbi:MAG: histidine--tRNA ligase [FCB group bacterium]|nr:histidine--tRNA ligase [FCB group bacterium]